MYGNIVLHGRMYFTLLYYSGISSLCFTKHGEALYLHSSSELQRVSLSAQHITQAHCHLELPPGVRPGKETEAEEEEEEEEAEDGSEEESPQVGLEQWLSYQ